ncbi:hypothetical protein UF75_5211 [Desulfosporosinus sp. I2]|nr:hypothetical protein UF75_5211 [Desulfosporosinus sp. I2]
MLQKFSQIVYIDKMENPLKEKITYQKIVVTNIIGYDKMYCCPVQTDAF